MNFFYRALLTISLLCYLSVVLLYTAGYDGQVDARWTDEIEEDFLNWLLDGRSDRLPVSIEEMQEFLQHRTW